MCRQLLLFTIPILLVVLIVLVVVNGVILSTELHAIISTISVGIYMCFFVMGLGPIPNIMCAEIFPTNIRVACSTIYGLTYWICDIIVTYSLTLLMRSIGLEGVFGICAIDCFFLFCYLCFARSLQKSLQNSPHLDY
jgi:sugar phosphate permease